MPIPNGIKTPGVYTDVNINTQRAGLLPNTQRVLFISSDAPTAAMPTPVDVYDTAQADSKFGASSVLGRMIKAAIKTNRLVNAQGFSLTDFAGGGGSGGGGSGSGGSSATAHYAVLAFDNIVSQSLTLEATVNYLDQDGLPQSLTATVSKAVSQPMGVAGFIMPDSPLFEFIAVDSNALTFMPPPNYIVINANEFGTNQFLDAQITLTFETLPSGLRTSSKTEITYLNDEFSLQNSTVQISGNVVTFDLVAQNGATP